MLCPSPLVSVNASQLAAYPDYVLLEQAYENCYVPCPNIEMTTNEWDTLKTTILTLVIISFVTSFIACISHIIVDTKKYYTTVMFIGGFCLYSFFLMIFLLLNRKNQQICYDDAAYIERGGLCVFQSASSVFLFLWIEVWSVLLAYDSLRQIYRRVSYVKGRASQDRLHRSYTVIALLFSAIVTSIPLIARDLGYDPKANVPICFFIGSETSTSVYFWFCFFLPFYVLLLLCIVITISGMIRINSVMVLSSLRLQSNAAKRTSNNLGTGNDTDIKAPLLGQASKGDDQADTSNNGDIIMNRNNPDIDIERDLSLNLSLSKSFGDLSDVDDDDESDSLSIIQDIFRMNNRRGLQKISSSGSVTSLGTTTSDVEARRLNDQNSDSGIAAVRASDNPGSPTQYNWSKTWNIMRLIFKYNSRNIIFVLLFGISTLSLGPVCINTYYFKYNHFIDVANDFVDCLVQAGLSSPVQTQSGVNSFAFQQCGAVPSSRPHLTTLYSILIWVSSYGIIPALVYGVAPGTIKAMRHLLVGEGKV